MSEDPTGAQRIIDGLEVKGDIVSLAKEPDRLQRILNEFTPDELRFVKAAIDALKERAAQRS